MLRAEVHANTMRISQNYKYVVFGGQIARGCRQSYIYESKVKTNTKSQATLDINRHC